MFFFKRQKLSGRVSILIPTMFDSRYIIELCLKSIKKYTDYPDYRIIVCDAGVDEMTRSYLEALARQGEIRLIKAADWQRPKDDLARAVDTPYYILMHDDIQILKRGWLTRRMGIMSRHKDNAIVGSLVKNYNSGVQRFFPLGLLVKTEVSRLLDLKWGKQPGFDTGALAYQKFFSQKSYRFVSYKVSRDIRHFSDMTWPLRKKLKYHDVQSYQGLDVKLKEREEKINLIRQLLDSNKY